MHQKRSLDDTCDIFLSRSRMNSSSLLQRSASEFPRYSSTLSQDSIKESPCFFPPRSLGCSWGIDTRTSSASMRPLPLPGSSGIMPPKSTRSANGRQHIPRPRNPFILFRCDFVHQRKMQPRTEVDDTNISRIAGEIWRDMTAEEKRPWVELAALEKERHALLFPDYKYAPVQGGSKGKKGKNENLILDERTARQLSQMVAALSAEYATHGTSSGNAEVRSTLRGRRQPERSRPYPKPLPRRRSSSCPPVGAVPVLANPLLEGWMPSLVSQDDMRRRPSRTVMYQSVTSQPITEPFFPMPVGHCLPFVFQENNWLGSPQLNPWMPDLNVTYLTSDAVLHPEPREPLSSYFSANKPIFSPSVRDPGFTEGELLRMQSLNLGSTFTDPFSSSPTDVDSGAIELSYPYPTPISPLDCSDYLSGSSSSGSFSAN